MPSPSSTILPSGSCYGASPLGPASRLRLATRHRVGRMVLEGSFTSAADVGAHAYRFLPVRLLMKEQFRSDLQIAKVTAPLLFLHGGRDWVSADRTWRAALC